VLFAKVIKQNRIKSGMEAIPAPVSTAGNYPGTIHGVWAEPGSYVEWYRTFLPNGKVAITGYKIYPPIKQKHSPVF